MNETGSNSAPASPRNRLLPGMAAISIWMLALAIIGVVGVLTHRAPAGGGRIVILLFSTLFAIAGLGLIRGRRWGWALALGAAFFSMSFAFFSLFRWHQSQWIFMGAVNLIFFLYLVRPEVVGRVK